MPVKPANAKVDNGPITRGKGLDTLDRFIIQNWPRSACFGVWRKDLGALAPAKGSLEHFLNGALEQGWLRDGGGAVITIDPSGDPLVTLRVESEIKHWSPDQKYHPKHWLWKVVPIASAMAELEAALESALPEEASSYLKTLREGIPA